MAAQITIKYVESDPEQVKKAFDTLMTWTGMNKQRVLEVMNWNSIAVTNSNNWEMEYKGKVNVFKNWEEGIWVAIGEDYNYLNTGYTVVQAHTTQAGWEPPNVPALFKRKPIIISGENYPKWVQPLGSTDAYALDDRVTHNGKDWESDVNDNVWEPGVSQWSELSGSTPSSGCTGVEEWNISQSWTTYTVGDQRTNNNQLWELHTQAWAQEEPSGLTGYLGWTYIQDCG